MSSDWYAPRQLRVSVSSQRESMSAVMPPIIAAMAAAEAFTSELVARNVVALPFGASASVMLLDARLMPALATPGRDVNDDEERNRVAVHVRHRGKRPGQQAHDEQRAATHA